jgi:hypothetical protein
MTPVEQDDEERLVVLVVRVLHPPGLEEGQVFGPQDRDRHIAAADGSGRFRWVVRARRLAGGGTGFLGPWVHGPASARFLYLTLLDQRPVPPVIVRRIKVPLAGIPWATVSAMGEGHALEAVLDGRRAGTVALLNQGWIRPT